MVQAARQRRISAEANETGYGNLALKSLWPRGIQTPTNSSVGAIDQGIQTPTNPSAGTIDPRIHSRSLEAVRGRPNRDNRRVRVIT